MGVNKWHCKKDTHMGCAILYLYQVAALWEQSLKLFWTAAVLIYSKKFSLKYHMMFLLTVCQRNVAKIFKIFFIFRTLSNNYNRALLLS